MICGKCNQPGVKNSALNKEFYYCRTCKDEIGLSSASASPTPSQTQFSPMTYGKSISIDPSSITWSPNVWNAPGVSTRLGPHSMGFYIVRQVNGIWEATPTLSSAGFHMPYIQGYFCIDFTGKITVENSITHWMSP